MTSLQEKNGYNVKCRTQMSAQLSRKKEHDKNKAQLKLNTKGWDVGIIKKVHKQES